MESSAKLKDDDLVTRMPLFREGKFYPPYYLDFSEPKPNFYQDEPHDKDDKVDWRNAKREFETYELDPWKERKRVHEKRQKELPTPSGFAQLFLGTSFSPTCPSTGNTRYRLKSTNACGSDMSFWWVQAERARPPFSLHSFWMI
jgi:hypothetical protein